MLIVVPVVCEAARHRDARGLVGDRARCVHKIFLRESCPVSPCNCKLSGFAPCDFCLVRLAGRRAGREQRWRPQARRESHRSRRSSPQPPRRPSASTPRSRPTRRGRSSLRRSSRRWLRRRSSSWSRSCAGVRRCSTGASVRARCASRATISPVSTTPAHSYSRCCYSCEQRSSGCCACPRPPRGPRRCARFARRCAIRRTARRSPQPHPLRPLHPLHPLHPLQRWVAACAEARWPPLQRASTRPALTRCWTRVSS